jgi:hypothetical protein
VVNVKAFVKGVEFEISDDKDVELLALFVSGDKPQDDLKKSRKRVEPIIRKVMASRKERVRQAVLLAKEKGISFGEAAKQIGVPVCGPTYKLARELGYSGNFKGKKHKHRRYRKSRRFLAWTQDEDNVVLENTPKKAKKLLARTFPAIYMRRRQLKQKKKITEKKETPVGKQKIPELSFDMLSRNATCGRTWEQTQDKTNLYLAILEHSIRKEIPMKTKDLVALLQLSVSEARALLIDTFQQQQSIFAKFRASGKMVLENSDVLEFRK